MGVQQAGAAHLGALVDRQPVLLQVRAGQQQRSQGAGGAAGRGVLRDAGERGEHAGAEGISIARIGQQAEPALPGWRLRQGGTEAGSVRGGCGQGGGRDLGDRKAQADAGHQGCMRAGQHRAL